MKISGKQLEAVLYKLKYFTLGYSDFDKKDFEVDISLSQEDPGSGIMVDTFTIKALKPQEEGGDRVETMVVELYPASEQQDPRASKTESFKITSKY